MTFFVFLCTVCERFVHSFVKGLFERKYVTFQVLIAFVHDVHANARTYACGRVRVCAHTYTCAYTRMYKPCTLCTHSKFSLKNNGIDVLRTVHKLCTNPAHCAQY